MTMKALSDWNAKAVRNDKKFSSHYTNNLQPSLQLVPIRDLYPVRYEFSDIAAHRAIVLLPYQVSILNKKI